jgi:putative membrane-bound dehydrogenase-like protein
MNRRLVWLCLSVAVVVVHGPLSAQSSRRTELPADEVRPAADRPQPKSPQESATCIRLPPGFKLELVAAEPLVREPTAMCFDEVGRLFACEIHGYNLDGYLDIVELNKTGRLDREVRRVRHATPESQAEAAKETYGTVRMLRDGDGDGRMDASVVWADRLPPCYGVIAARGGVIAVCAPDIVFLADRDGDGSAEVRQTLFTGFSREFIERGINNPRWGVDNWIYVAAGGGGGRITGPNLQAPVSIGHTDFRFKPDGTAIEPVTGTESMFGLTMTDFGDRFHTILQQVVPLPYHYLARNPYVPSPPGDLAINAYREIYPISQPDPWRLARGSDPEWIKYYGPMETKPNGYFTATSGQLIYRADALPAEFHGNYFVCDPANNLVHRCVLERDGLIYTGRRAPGEERSEFLASTDQWFRPMNLGIGPDGAIYVVDMYREVIEDFSAIPRFLQQQYAESLIAGKDHGRIWRLSAASPVRPTGDMRSMPAGLPERVALLGHANHWWRETAQRLLVESGDRTARELLAELAESGQTPQGRLHALYTLDGLGALRSADVEAALGDASFGVRMHALQLSERWLNGDPSLLERVLGLIDDPDPRVRLQAALTLGEARDPRAIDALARFSIGHGNERWSAAAVASSAVHSADMLLDQLLEVGPASPGVLALLGPLAETVGATRDDRQIGRLLSSIAGLSSDEQVAAQRALLDGLARGLSRGKPGLATGEAVPQAIETLLASSDAEVRRKALGLVEPLQLAESVAMQRAWDSAAETALDGGQPLSDRLRAISILSAAGWIRLERLRELLDARQPVELQLAAVAALSRSDHPDAALALLSNWSGLFPQAQEEITDALFARQDRLPKLLDAVESGVVPPNSLTALRREQLTEHGSEPIRTRARKLLSTSPSEDRAAVIVRYEAALTLPRDLVRGAAVFEKSCSRCHRLGDKGYEVGPDLSAARTRPDATLLSDILDPSGTLTPGFAVYTIVTVDGRVHTGLRAGESATNITLRIAARPDEEALPGQPLVTEATILRKDVDEARLSSQSLMPDGLEKEHSVQDIADLLGFLRHSLGEAIGTGIVLFDDQQAFLDSLVEGGAEATLTTTDAHSGEAALHLTVGQRYSPRIPGWTFRIVERPALGLASPDPADRRPAGDSSGESGIRTGQPQAPDEFRYLRFAWKSAGAKGLMFELADDGRWPPADEPLRRYYAGTNSSGWKATEVTPDVPTDWTIVTVDLWKDFGDFTLTGIAPTAMGGSALFDRIELLRTLDAPASPLPPGP